MSLFIKINSQQFTRPRHLFPPPSTSYNDRRHEVTARRPRHHMSPRARRRRNLRERRKRARCVASICPSWPGTSSMPMLMGILTRMTAISLSWSIGSIKNYWTYFLTHFFFLFIITHRQHTTQPGTNSTTTKKRLCRSKQFIAAFFTKYILNTF